MINSNVHPAAYAIAMGVTTECYAAVQTKIASLIPMCLSELGMEIVNNPPPPCNVDQAAACFNNLMWMARNNQGPFRRQDGQMCEEVIPAPAEPATA